MQQEQLLESATDVTGGGHFADRPCTRSAADDDAFLFLNFYTSHLTQTTPFGPINPLGEPPSRSRSPLSID